MSPQKFTTKHVESVDGLILKNMPQHVNTFVLGIVKSPEILRNIKTEIRMSKFIRSQIGTKVFPRLP